MQAACEFSEIERQLEEALTELKRAPDANYRRTLMMGMRVLLIEGDHLLLESGETQNGAADSR